MNDTPADLAEDALDVDASLPEALVLLVDDNQQNIELIQAYLDDLPCRTATAVDGVAAMEAACAAALAHAHAGEIAMADTRTRPPTALEVAQALPTALEQLTRGGGQLPTLTAPREVSA